MEILEAVEAARRTRGMVMLTTKGWRKQWCAVLVAVDGALELRVGNGDKGWLRDHGFAHLHDAWALPVPAGTSAQECAATLQEALDTDRPLHQELAHPGSASGALPSPDAPRDEHIAAALHDLVEAGRGRVDLSGGRPNRLWAIVWAFPDDRELQIEPELDAKDVWREPLTPDGAAAAARELARRTEGEAGPLFVEYLAP